MSDRVWVPNELGTERRVQRTLPFGSYFLRTLLFTGRGRRGMAANQYLHSPPCTTGKSRIGEVAPMALCDIHGAGCGEHLPAWGLGDDRIPGH